MAIDTGLLFKIKADGSQAKAEARETAAAVKNALGKDALADFQAEYAAKFADLHRRAEALRKGATDAGKGLDEFGQAAKRSRADVGQFIEALAQGDPGELLGEIAQQGGKAGIAIAGVTLAAGGAVAAIAALTARTIELVRETDKLAKDTKLSSDKIQALQVIANLTGESVEDLAENYKKLGPEVKRFEALVKQSGAAIDEDLRAKTQQAALAWEKLKLTADGALNELAKSLLPVVTSAINDMTGAISNADGAITSLGRSFSIAFSDIIADIKEAVHAIQLLISGLEKIDNWDFKGGFSDIGKAIKGDKEGFRRRQFEKTFGVEFDTEAGGLSSGWGAPFYGDSRDFGGGFPTVPRLSGGSRGGRGRSDISEAELAIRLMRAQQDEAQRGLNGTAEAAQRLYEITMKLHEAERQQAQSELPNARAAKLAEIQQKEKEALERYNEILSKIRDEELKPIEDLVKRTNEGNAETLRLLELQRQAEEDIKDIMLERKAAQLDADRLDVELARSSGASKTAVRQLELDAARKAEDLDFERRQRNLERDRAQALKKYGEGEEFLKIEKALNAKFREEKLAHALALIQIDELIKQNERERQAERERQNPLSARSLFGDGFAELLKLHEGNVFPALAQSATQAFEQMSAAAGNFGTIAGSAFGQLTQGLGEMLGALILGGETGPAALRKLTAAVLANVAQQAAVKAVFELAAGFASLFWNPAEAAAHFTAAALYGSVAAAAGFAARAVAPATEGGSTARSASAASAGNSRRVINQDTAQGRRELTIDGQPTSYTRQQATTAASAPIVTSGDLKSRLGSYRNEGILGNLRGVDLTNRLLGDIAEFTRRLMLSFDRYVETTPGARKGFNQITNRLSQVALSFIGFDQGGYTGDGLSNALAGAVHRGEFVFSSKAVRNIGLGNLEAMHTRAKAGMAPIGAGSLGGSREPIHLVVHAPEGFTAELVAKDYLGNGTTRQIIRADILGQGN